MRKKLTILLTVPLALWSCAAVLGIEAPELVTRDASAVDGGGLSPDVADEDSGTIVYSPNACTKEPACGAAPDPALGVFVHGKDGTDSPACGALGTPCKSIQVGLDRARASSTPGLAVFVAPGKYVEAIALHSAAAIVGGFEVEGGKWKRRCDVEAIGLVTIEAPFTVTKTVSALDLGGRASIDSVVVRSKQAAAAGESLYGIFASAEATSLCLANVIVEVARAGDGASGVAGVAGAQRSCTGADGGEDGAAGSEGDAGSAAPVGAFGESGWIAASGAAGADGTRGNDGAFQAHTCPKSIECTVNGKCQQFGSSSVCEPQNPVPCPFLPKSGCGGGSGGGGGGGGSGGSSVALFVSGATVDVRGGAFVANAGGAGGVGGDGGTGAQGTPGDAGTCMECVDEGALCNNKDPVITPPSSSGVAQTGGKGGNGGTGGAGASGVSCAYYKHGFGRITLDGTRLERPDAGDAGLPTECN